jgi:two-component system nitrogen regulation response regulator GlnG
MAVLWNAIHQQGEQCSAYYFLHGATGNARGRWRMPSEYDQHSDTILVADDDDAIRTVLNQALSREGFNVRATSNASVLWKWISQGEGDLVVTDVVMPDENAFDMLPRIKKARPDLPVIVMSAQNTFMTAIRASEKGAYEYLPKPFDLGELITIAKRALAEPRPRSQNAQAGEQIEPMPLVGRSPAMQDIYRMLARMMQTDLTVMVSGESGTGKELVARALHEYGRRSSGPFVAINMAAIPRDLIESELFGHEKGAFTGAQHRSSGRFEQAEGGTLFLDEIGDMPMEAQTRLLRVLQQGEYTTVGGRTPIKSDVRIVAATNKDLRILINNGQFREDLYYRLNVVPLRLPPLRERKQDIPDLVEHFFKQGEKEKLPLKRIEPAGYELLKAYSWPGNVRELENLVRRLAALYPQEDISAEIIESELNTTSAPQGADHVAAISDDIPLGKFMEQYLSNHFSSFDDGTPPPGLYQRILSEVEYPLIVACLSATRGNQIKAAELLGVNRNTLRKKIRDLGVNVFRIPK